MYKKVLILTVAAVKDRIVEFFHSALTDKEVVADWMDNGTQLPNIGVMNNSEIAEMAGEHDLFASEMRDDPELDLVLMQDGPYHYYQVSADRPPPQPGKCVKCGSNLGADGTCSSLDCPCRWTNQPKNYNVTVARITRPTQTFSITANSPEQAGHIAVDDFAPNATFGSGDYEYEVVSVEKVQGSS